MTKFYFVRHGKTELNLHSRFQGGNIDSPLLPEAIEQAVEAGNFLRTVAFDCVAVSTQKRAMATANYILMENKYKDNLVVHYYDALREIQFGDREGKKIQVEEEQTFHLLQKPDLYDPSHFNGETMDELVERSTKVINQMNKDYPEGTVLLVAHGVLLITLMNVLLGKEKKEWRKGGPLDNTSISIVEKNNEDQTYHIISFNDTSYQFKNKR